MDPTTTPNAPMVPAVQKPTGSNSNSMLNALSAALNPQSAAALATVEANVQNTPPPAPVTTAPEVTPVTPAAPVAEALKETAVENRPLKKGFDSLDVEPEAPKAADPVQEHSDLPPDATTPQAKNAWSAIKTEAKELRTKVEALEAEKARLAAEAAKAKQFTEADPEWKKYQELQKRLEEVEPVIARVAYQKTPAYREAVEVPRNALGVQAKTLADQFEIPEAKMVSALTESDPKRQTELLTEIADGMDERSKVRLFRIADDLEHIYNLDERMAQNAMKAHQEAEAVETQRQQQATIERKAAEMRAITDSKEKLMKVAKAFKVGDESEDQAVNAILTAANSTPFGEHSTEDAAFAVIAAQLVPRFMQNIRDLQSKLAAKEQYISQMAAANPRAAAGQQGQVNGTMMPATLMDGIRADMAKLGIR